ncbi:MAG TPA: single-stranded-DNA-specific exonuclease RecJ [Candidatus Hydrogenedentes bacterium]|nr:single-stranded-DNA-specific exonuclease RecJ [Candidatus Hydrogenedentota bacterium]
MSATRMRHHWTIADMDRARTRALAEATGLPHIIAQLLLQRGAATADEARHYLQPSVAHLSDPFSLTGMRAAVERITQARDHDEHVLIFGDYDVDGIAAAALLINGLKRFGLQRVTHGMPLRLTEGYGLNAEHVAVARAEGVNLIITVDNGISAHEAARRAKDLGIDLLITDHHAIEEGLPEACAVINPKQDSPDHPARNLCGAGVAFKLSMALNGTPNDLDIAALGTVADIVPLTGENRIIVALGLRHMARYERLGLSKLAAEAGLSLRDISSEKIGFQLGPRLNAAGRLNDGRAALQLLLSDCPIEAGRIAAALNEANEERRSIERGIFEAAVEELDACFDPRQRSIVLARRGWHVGVIGIVASRINAEYNRPVVLIALDEEGVGRGSARSGPNFDMMAALTECQEYLERFGGHRSAAGLTLAEEAVPAFRSAFEAAALRQLGAGELLPELTVDVVASFSQLDGALLKTLEQLEPFGHGNPAPIFCSAGVELVPSSARIIKDNHLRMALRQGDVVLSAIGFFMAERYFTEGLPSSLDIAYIPQLNTYRNETSVQLLLKDYRPAED